MQDLKGRVAIVTGGASGIGAAIVEHFVQQGAAVAIADRDFDLAESLVKKLQADAAAKVMALRVDVTIGQEVEAMVAQVEQAFGGPDILVTSAGIGLRKDFLDTTFDEWNRVLAVNLTGAFLCGQAAARRMVKRGYGRIVNISSGAGVRGIPGRAAYAASKAGLISLTQVMAAELGTHGVTVNAITPGPIDTPLTQEMHTGAIRAAYVGRIPVGRYGRTREVAAAAAFLASEDASYITADTLQVDGGMAATNYIINI
ncbi:hypothetical protein BWP39_31045 [Paraburkholderia acidicola]|uniref:Ketoreductase domain-containing protein n=1 Tax=Paraburkholderia acidicola TaxID=1912599 RepID=A0A2A4EUY0_9BURK|nr:hypothetical protein BWP39_31045 [Paraburkholderia acidicola]